MTCRFFLAFLLLNKKVWEVAQHVFCYCFDINLSQFQWFCSGFKESKAHFLMSHCTKRYRSEEISPPLDLLRNCKNFEVFFEKFTNWSNVCWEVAMPPPFKLDSTGNPDLHIKPWRRCRAWLERSFFGNLKSGVGSRCHNIHFFGIVSSSKYPDKNY